MRGPGPRVHQGRDHEVHRAQAGLHQRISRLPQVCQRPCQHDWGREEGVPSVHYWLFIFTSWWFSKSSSTVCFINQSYIEQSFKFHSFIRLTIVRKIEAGDGSYPSVNTCVHYLKVCNIIIHQMQFVFTY